jgi:hypothetical protein
LVARAIIPAAGEIESKSFDASQPRSPLRAMPDFSLRWRKLNIAQLQAVRGERGHLERVFLLGGRAAERRIGMKTLAATASAALLGAGILAFMATGASARIVCNDEGDCWHHTGPEVVYPAEAHIVVHPDHWKWKEGEHYRWHEHEGRGYWHGGVWVNIR